MIFSKSRSTMRTLLPATALAGLLLAVTAPAGQARQDSVTGTGRHQGADPPFPVIQVHINALADATGADARGNLISDMTSATIEGRYVGRVTCLNVFASPFGSDARSVSELGRNRILSGKRFCGNVDGHFEARRHAPPFLQLLRQRFARGVGPRGQRRS